MLSAAERAVPLPFHGVAFTVLGPPRAKARPATFIEGGKVRRYKDDKTANYEKLVGLSFLARRPRGWTLEGEFELSIVVHLKDRQHQPDISNVLKAIEDGGNRLIWHDDRQLVRVEGRLVFGAPVPKVDVTVTRL
jgi:Holliday junction resolvase RusA-like endonuclease